MKFNKPLSVNAAGGHGPIRYYVEKYESGKLVQFYFTAPKGFDGHHAYEIIEKGNGKTELRETLKMETHGLAVLSWPLIFCPLHDALIEDSLTCAEVRLGIEPKTSNWSTWLNYYGGLLQAVILDLNNCLTRQFNLDILLLRLPVNCSVRRLLV